ncbi:MAG: MurR/RpiR family transcriptional regulator [Anaerolineae bacterium]|nr:MurR/RpiR family transcriptional regulator [Anaerolineae bacterium]
MPTSRQSEGSLSRIERAYSGLGETRRRVAEYVLQHPTESVGLSIVELARLSGVSESTVLRFARELGYGGYREFALALASSRRDDPDRTLQVDVTETDEPTTILQKVFAAEARALTGAWKTIEAEELHRAVEALAGARRVHCFAVGGSGLLATEAVYRFVRLGIDCYAIYDPIQIAIHAGRMAVEDVAIGFSQTGRTRDTVEGLKAARAAGATTICITSQPHSPIIGASDIKLVLLELHTAYRTAYLDSKIAELTLIDALSASLARRMAPRSAAEVDRLNASIERMFLTGSESRARHESTG